MSEDSFTRTDDEDAIVIDDTTQNVSGGSDTAPITVQAQKLIEDLNELAPQDKLPDMILHQLCTLFSRGYESGKRLPAEVRLEIMGALGMWLRNCTRVGWEFSQHKWFSVVRDLSFSELEALLRPIQSSTVLRELEFHDRVGVSNFTSEIYTSEFWALIAGIIRSAENLQVFRASSVGMSVTGLSLIAEAFTCRYVSNLIHLDLSCNPIANKEGFLLISKILGAARYLKRLVLSGTCVDWPGANVLALDVTLHHRSDDLVLDLDTESILIQARDTQSYADSGGEEDCDDDEEEEPTPSCRKAARRSLTPRMAAHRSLRPLQNRSVEIDRSLQHKARREEHFHLEQLQFVPQELGGTSSKCGRVVLCGAHLSGKISNMKFEVEKFDGKNNFGLWQLRVKDLLVQQGLHKALEKKPLDMTDSEWKDIDLRAISIIRLSLADEILYNVMHEDSTPKLWSKLQSLYMTKFLTSRLYLKQKLYILRMKQRGNSKISNAKFEVEKFDGKNNFELWQSRVKDLLIQQGLHKALGKKPTDKTDSEWKDIDLRAVSTIRLNLADEILYNVMHEDSTSKLWTKLKSLYMTKISFMSCLYGDEA